MNAQKKILYVILGLVLVGVGAQIFVLIANRKKEEDIEPRLSSIDVGDVEQEFLDED